eukprot:CAMPEP_0182531524 /NCGR_PEP_ID=MMETSP1323-20130603/9324_1 /TAXON_ID=236787 /ORGANISM="Florenciella parvula, Strain RCC1693" /LENGTH=52 /DNA_ID=CAMNT_0024741089 /DNA_START=48 /DNA_END=206 /DNA_ORIENTATION=+
MAQPTMSVCLCTKVRLPSTTYTSSSDQSSGGGFFRAPCDERTGGERGAMNAQ